MKKALLLSLALLVAGNMQAASSNNTNNVSSAGAWSKLGAAAAGFGLAIGITALSLPQFTDPIGGPVIPAKHISTIHLLTGLVASYFAIKAQKLELPSEYFLTSYGMISLIMAGGTSRPSPRK